MSDRELERKTADALWTAHTLFQRGKATGSTANISFIHDNKMYISATNSSFGRLKEGDFAILGLDGEQQNLVKPSKEYPLHLAMYKNNEAIQAVIHTHSFYATLWSCMPEEKTENRIPQYTPYLKMKLGNVSFIPYASPGSAELFELFGKCLDGRKGYLLKNHGPVIGDKDLLSAFYSLEELEESARLAWELRKEGAEELK
jgi:ribulose-5-phosphate 4-epimerase/fuculose-1-phosphate aldolase